MLQDLVVSRTQHFYPFVFKRRQHLLGQRLHLHKKLRQGEWLQRPLAPVTYSNTMFVIGVILDQQSIFLKILLHLPPHRRYLQPMIFLGSRQIFLILIVGVIQIPRKIHQPIKANNRRHRQIIFFAQFKVVRVMCWGYFHNSRPKLWIYQRISNDLHLHRPQQTSNFVFLTNLIFVSGVIRVHRQRRVAKLSLWPHRPDCKLTILDLVKRRHPFFMLHFQARKSRSAVGAVVHQLHISVHQTVFIKFLKRLNYLRNYWRLQHKLKPTPVSRRPHSLHLLYRHPRIFLHVLPDHLVKRFSVKIKPAFALFGQLLLKHKLCLDPGMVRTRKPQGCLALHPGYSDHHILKRHKHCMPHMQRIIGIGRGHNDCKRLGARIICRPEPTAFLPCSVNLLLVIFVVIFRIHAGSFFQTFSAFLFSIAFCLDYQHSSRAPL